MPSTRTFPPSAPATAAVRPRTREPQPTRARARAWLWVLLFTYAAAFVRFAGISHTSGDSDEALVYFRTCGTFGQLVDLLRNDGFVPLHYEFHWALKHLLVLSPGVMRFLPALAAVLMVPAMYFLARQFVGRQTALVVAAFTAVSAFIGWRAQYAKMYSHLWLFCTLSMGSLLWWLRNRSGVAWWCWVASSVAAVGLHSLAWGVIALQPVVFLAHFPRFQRWRMVLALLAGLITIGAGPAVYYTCFNQWTSNIRKDGWAASGLLGVGPFNASRSPGELALLTYSDYLLGQDYPSPLLNGIADAPLLQAVPTATACLLLLGAFPWPMRGRGRGRGPSPEDAPMSQPWWRVGLVLTAWAALIPYAFYCASFDMYRWPHELLADLCVWLYASPKFGVLALAMLMLACYCCSLTWRERVLRGLQLTMVSCVVLGLATAIAWAFRHRPPGPLWLSHYIAIAWSAIVIATIALIMRIPNRFVRWSVVGILLAINLAVCLDRVRWPHMPPIDLAAMDVVSASRTSNTYVACTDGEPPALLQYTYEGQYYLHLLSGVQIPPYGFSPTVHDFKSISPVVASLIPAQVPQSQIPRDLINRPDVRHLIIWDRIASPATNQAPDPALLREPPGDDLLPQFPGTWRRTRTNRYAFYQVHTWDLRGIWRRREYVRTQ